MNIYRAVRFKGLGIGSLPVTGVGICAKGIRFFCQTGVCICCSVYRQRYILVGPICCVAGHTGSCRRCGVIRVIDNSIRSVTGSCIVSGSKRSPIVIPVGLFIGHETETEVRTPALCPGIDSGLYVKCIPVLGGSAVRTITINTFRRLCREVIIRRFGVPGNSSFRPGRPDHVRSQVCRRGSAGRFPEPIISRVNGAACGNSVRQHKEHQHAAVPIGGRTAKACGGSGTVIGSGFVGIDCCIKVVCNGRGRRVNGNRISSSFCIQPCVT